MKTLTKTTAIRAGLIASALFATSHTVHAGCRGDVALQLLNNSVDAQPSEERNVLIWLGGKPVGYVGSAAQLDPGVVSQLDVRGQDLSFVALTGPQGMVRTLGGERSPADVSMDNGALLPGGLNEFSTVVSGQGFALQVRTDGSESHPSYRFVSSGVSVQFNDRAAGNGAASLPATEFASLVVQELMPRSEIVAKNVSVRLQANVQSYADTREDTMCIELAALDQFASIK